MRTLRERIPSPSSVGWMTVVWVFLWGEITLGNVVNGLLIAYLVGMVFPLPKVGGLNTFRPLAFAVLAGKFMWDILVSGFRVAYAAIRPGVTKSGVIRVQLRSHSDFVLATTAGMTTLIPGSVAINTHRITGVVYLHVFDVPAKGSAQYLDDFRQNVLHQEERLLRAFASDEELADAGFLPGWRIGTGDVPGWIEEHGAREHRIWAGLPPKPTGKKPQGKAGGGATGGAAGGSSSSKKPQGKASGGAAEGSSSSSKKKRGGERT